MTGPATFLGRTPTELKPVFAHVRALIYDGKDDLEIAAELGITLAECDELLRRFYEHELLVERKRTTDHHYLNYLLEQRANLKALSGMIRDFGKSKQFNAQVGAIRAKADILEKVLDRAQEFGFIDLRKQAPMINGILVANIGTADIRKEIGAVINEVRRLAAGGEASMDAIDIGPLHADDVIDVTPDAPEKAKSKRGTKKRARRADPDALDQEPPL